MRRRRHSLLYLLYLRSPIWRLRRRVWIIRALGRCEQCARRRGLTIHHRTYRRLGHERRSDITVLCWRCHQLQHAPARPRSAWRNWWPPTRAGYQPALHHRRRATTSRVALLVLIALPAVVALSSWIPHR
jgi:hypothetical protein